MGTSHGIFSTGGALSSYDELHSYYRKALPIIIYIGTHLICFSNRASIGLTLG